MHAAAMQQTSSQTANKQQCCLHRPYIVRSKAASQRDSTATRQCQDTWLLITLTEEHAMLFQSDNLAISTDMLHVLNGPEVVSSGAAEARNQPQYTLYSTVSSAAFNMWHNTQVHGVNCRASQEYRLQRNLYLPD
jgi:hypothetical protein